MGGINDIRQALIASGLKPRNVTMSYDNEAGEQVFEFEVEGREKFHVRAGPALLADEIAGLAIAQINQAEAPREEGVEMMPQLGPKLGLMSMPEPQLTEVERAIEQIKAGDYDLVPDEEPEPKPALFFYDPKENAP